MKSNHLQHFHRAIHTHNHISTLTNLETNKQTSKQQTTKQTEELCLCYYSSDICFSQTRNIYIFLLVFTSFLFSFIHSFSPFSLGFCVYFLSLFCFCFFYSSLVGVCESELLFSKVKIVGTRGLMQNSFVKTFNSFCVCILTIAHTVTA